MRLALLAFLSLAAVTSAAAAEKAWYGFHIKPQFEGFPLNPIVRSVTIDRVRPNSPATAHRIRVGDEILEAEGRVVPGSRALAWIFLRYKQPGDSLRLRLKRRNGESYTAVVQGIKEPD